MGIREGWQGCTCVWRGAGQPTAREAALVFPRAVPVIGAAVGAGSSSALGTLPWAEPRFGWREGSGFGMQPACPHCPRPPYNAMGLQTPGAAPGHPQPGTGGISRTPHLAQPARSGCSSHGCSTSPPSGMRCRCDILSHSLAQWHCQHGGSIPGSLQREMLHAAVQPCPREQGLLQGHQDRHQPTSHPLLDPRAGIPWSEQQYLWWAGGRSRPSQSGSTSQHQGSHGQRGSTGWGARGLRSPPPGTHPLWVGQEGQWGSSVPAGPRVGMQ